MLVRDAGVDFPFEDLPIDEPPFEKFHRIAWICQHWRNVAVGAPLLWTRLYSSLHDYSLLMLGRTRSGPIDVHIPWEASDAAVSVFLEHVERIKRLKCHLTPSRLRDMEASLARFGRNAPTLEELHLNSSNSNSSYAFSSTLLAAIQPTNLLRTLKLSGIAIDWQVFPLPHLSCLSLFNVRITTAISGKEFASALQGMPRLEELSIRFDSLRLHQYPSSPHANTVHLPRLTKLAIWDHESPSLVHPHYFLTHTALPALQQLYINVQWMPRGPDYYNPYTPILHATRIAIARGNFGTFQNLQLFWDHVLVSSSANGAYVELRYPVGVLSGKLSRSELTSIILSYFTPVDCPYLVELALMPGDLTKDELLRHFGHLPHLKNIEVCSSGLDTFLDSLQVLDDSPPETPLPFPNLECIHLFGHDFREPVGPAPESLLVDDLVRCLKERREHGAAIKKLILRGCICVKNVVERLEDIVPDVQLRP